MSTQVNSMNTITAIVFLNCSDFSVFPRFARRPVYFSTAVYTQSDATIYFTKTHIADLRTIIDVDGKEKPESDGTTTLR